MPRKLFEHEVARPSVQTDMFRGTWQMDRVKRIWYLSPMRAAKVQASLRIRAVSPEPPLLAHTSSESRGTFRQKARSLAPLNGWAGAVKICHDGMLEDTNSLDGAQLLLQWHKHVWWLFLHFIWFQSKIAQKKKQKKNILYVGSLCTKSGVSLQNRTSKTSFPLTTSTSTKA